LAGLQEIFYPTPQKKYIRRNLTVKEKHPDGLATAISVDVVTFPGQNEEFDRNQKNNAER
jgi:hypothetical protein